MAEDTKRLSNPYSTGGGGYQFESHVQAAFLILMLTNGYCPCFPNKTITKIKLQAKNDGFELDDLVVFLVDRNTKEEVRLLAQIKHTISVTCKDKTFKEVILSAWKDFKSSSSFRKTKDKMALITGPISAIDIDNVRTILDWAHDNGKDYTKYFENISKANFSSVAKQKKLKAFEKNLKEANGGTSIPAEEFFEFLKHFHLIGYDLDIKHGVTQSLIHSHIAQYYPNDVSAVWAQVVLYVQDMNKKSGTITIEDIPDEIKKYFLVQKLSYIPTEYVPEISKTVLKPPAPSSKSLVLANFFGSWKESGSSDDLNLIKRFLNGI